MAFQRGDGGTIPVTGSAQGTDRTLVCKSSGAGQVVKDIALQQLPGDSMLNPTGVTSGTFGTSTVIPRFEVDRNGRIIGVTLASAVPASALTTAQADARYATSQTVSVQIDARDYLTSASADSRYLTTADGISAGAVSALIDARDYLTSTSIASTYQPIGSYLTTAVASTIYQPIGDYLTSASADARYLTTADGVSAAQVCTIVSGILTSRDYITSTAAHVAFLTTAEGDARYLTTNDTKLGVISMGTSRDVSVGDLENYLRTTSAVTLTIPTCASVAADIGSQVIIRQGVAGTLTVAAAGGVTLNVPVSTTAQGRGQHSTLTIVKASSDEWDIFGDLGTV
jgi:hypothetical protein